MCIQTTIQNKIAELTNDGEDIAAVLADILRGADPTVMTCHRLEAAKILTKYGTAQLDNITPITSAKPVGATLVVAHSDEVSAHSDSDSDEVVTRSDESEGDAQNNHIHPVDSTTVRPEPILSAAEGPVEGQELQATPTVRPEPVEGHARQATPTLRDIVSFPVARYIRERTNDGETLINALCYIMEGGHYSPDPFTGHPRPTVAPREKIAAAKELMRRAFGEYSPPRRASSTPVRPELVEGQDAHFELDPGDPVNSAIAQLVRDYTDNGVQAAELLIQVIESEPSGSEWKSSHRLIAAKELFHRAYDLNYEAVTWQDYEDYLHASEEYNKAYEIARARRKAETTAILNEYYAAQAAGDEDAMAAAEKKYRAYLRAERGEKEEEPEYPGYGPSDPDPTPKYPLRAPKRNRSRKNGRHTAASTTHTPKLTIPLHNRSP